MSRFHDPNTSVDSFTGDTLVVCPKCSACAISKRVQAESRDWFAPRKLVCSCAYSQEWQKREITRYRDGRDDYFGLPLWLQIACCGENLWAYNHEHLEIIESFVGAKLRERVKDAEYGWQNKSLISRLPQWIKSAKNREAILEAIQKLRKK